MPEFQNSFPCNKNLTKKRLGTAFFSFISCILLEGHASAYSLFSREEAAAIKRTSPFSNLNKEDQERYITAERAQYQIEAHQKAAQAKQFEYEDAQALWSDMREMYKREFETSVEQLRVAIEENWKDDIIFRMRQKDKMEKLWLHARDKEISFLAKAQAQRDEVKRIHEEAAQKLDLQVYLLKTAIEPSQRSCDDKLFSLIEKSQHSCQLEAELNQANERAEESRQNSINSKSKGEDHASNAWEKEADFQEEKANSIAIEHMQFQIDLGWFIVRSILSAFIPLITLVLFIAVALRRPQSCKSAKLLKDLLLTLRQLLQEDLYRDLRESLEELSTHSKAPPFLFAISASLKILDMLWANTKIAWHDIHEPEEHASAGSSDHGRSSADKNKDNKDR